MKQFLSIAAVGILAACSGSSDAPPAPDPTALVSLAQAQSGGVASTQSIYGTVEQNADTQYTLSAPVEATVSRIAAPVGTPVSRGQLVVALSASPSTRADLARLSADARSAQQAYERAQRLRTDGLVSDAEVESARAAAQGAQASRAALSTQSGQLALRAPGAGSVQSIATSPGNLVSAGTTVATISRNGDLRARFGIDPALIGRISRSAGVRLAPSGGGQSITVPIVSVDPAVDAQTRLASVYVRVPAIYNMGAGQPLSGEVTLEQSSDAVTVPYDALLNDGGQPYVFVVSQGAAHRKDVEIGASNGSRVAVTKGVQMGDQVVTRGGTALEDGMKVRTK